MNIINIQNNNFIIKRFQRDISEGPFRKPNVSQLYLSPSTQRAHSFLSEQIKRPNQRTQNLTKKTNIHLHHKPMRKNL